MNKMRKILVAICVFALVFGMFTVPTHAATSSQPSASYETITDGIQLTSLFDWFDWLFGPKTPTLNRTSISLMRGDKYTLTVFHAGRSTSWSSSDPNVATVSSKGLVTAVGVGDAEITAITNNTTLTCKVHVYQAEFTPSVVELEVGQSVTLKATLNGRPATISKYSIADTSVATVNNRGKITAIHDGETVLTATVSKVKYEIPVVVGSATQTVIADLDEEAIAGYVALLNENLAQDGLKIADVIKAVDVSLVDRNGNPVEPTGSVDVTLENVGLPTTLENVRLYHIGTEIEQLAFTPGANGTISFETDSVSPFILVMVEAIPEEPAEPQIVGLRIEVTSGTEVYTQQTLFTSHGELAFPEGYVAYVVYDNGDEVALPNGTWVELDPWCAPKTEGEFDVTFTYMSDEGEPIASTVITLNAVYPEPVMNTYAASYAAGLRGNVNGVSLKHIVFTDTEEPSDDVCASKAYIGDIEAHAVIAYRLTGHEDTLYITSGRPGVKVIHSGEGGTINSGFVEDVDCRMLDTSRCTTTMLFWANGGGFQHGVKRINYSGCDFSNVTSLGVAFNTYTSLEYLDLSNCNFSNVETLSHMCYNTPNLKTIDMSGTIFTPGKVTNLEYAFGDSGLETIKLGGLETSAVTTVQGMFTKDNNLAFVDLSRCDFTNVTSAAYMFQECGNLIGVNMPMSGMPNLEGSIRQMFDVCRNLREIDLSGLNFSKVSDVFRAFYRCESLQTTMNIDATLFDKSYGYTFADMAIGPEADVIVNCTQASHDILVDHMIWATSSQYTQHVTYNITDAVEVTINPLSDGALEEALAAINAKLAEDGKTVDEVVYAADISALETADVKIENMEIPDGAILYHIGADGVLVEVPYTVENGVLVFTTSEFSPFVLVTVKDIKTDEPMEPVDDGGYVVVQPVANNTDCNFAFMERGWFEEPDAFIKGLGSTLQGYMITYRDKDGNVIVPDGPRTVVIENVDMDAFGSDDEIVLAYTYIDPYVWDGNDNGVMYMNSVPYEYDAVNHTVTFEFDEFQPYYGNIMICQGGHRDLVVDEPHGPLTWSVNSNCPWGDVLVDQNGRVEVWGSFDNVEVTATDGEKTWVWLINGASNDIINLHPVVNVGETSYCYGYDDMIAGMYVSSEIRDDGRVDYQNECGAIRDNGDGTFTALKPGVYNLTVGFKYFLGQEGFAMQMGTITILGDEPVVEEPVAEPIIGSMSGDALDEAIAAVNAYLAGENKVIDEVFTAVNVIPNGATAIDVEGVTAPEGAILYHVSDDGTVTPISYTLVDGVLHFENDEFSPFLLVTVKDIPTEDPVDPNPTEPVDPEDPIVEEPTVSINPAFLGQWYAQGTGILWEVTVYEDGTFFNHYPNYSVGDMEYTWKLSDDGNTLILFEDNFSFDEYGNLVDKEWNAQGINYAQRILSRVPNIMGWWRSDDSFVEDTPYYDGEHGIAFYLNEHDYGKTFSLDPNGVVKFFNAENNDVYQYDAATDSMYVYHEDGTQSVLHRWYDWTVQ